MLTAALAVLCALLVLVLLVQRPAIWPVLVVLAVLWFALFGVFRYRVRSWVARWVCGGSFEKSKTQFSLEPLSQPAALLSGETVLWYNTEFRTRLMKGEALLVPRVQKVLPGLDLQEARKVSGQLLNLADGVWSAHSSTVPGEAESMTLLVLNEETALRKVEAEYKASRPGYLVFLVDGYDDVFSDMLDSERARLLEGINRVLEDMIGRGTGFLRRVASGRYIAVVEERQLEQFAKRGYDVLDKIRALDPSVNLSISIGIGRGAKTLREAQDMAVQALDMAQGRGGDQAAEMTPDGFTFYGGVSHGVEKRSKVRSRIVADQLVKLIKEADHVVIMGHRMSDLDAIGSAEGVLRICKICDVPAVIAVRRDATLAGSLINALIAAGQEDDFIDPKGALPIISQRTLCIVVDTYQLGLVESREILEKCGKVAVIDHHRKRFRRPARQPRSRCAGASPLPRFHSVDFYKMSSLFPALLYFSSIPFSLSFLLSISFPQSLFPLLPVFSPECSSVLPPSSLWRAASRALRRAYIPSQSAGVRNTCSSSSRRLPVWTGRSAVASCACSRSMPPDRLQSLQKTRILTCQ